MPSSRQICNRNDAVSEYCKNKVMFNAGNINGPSDTPFILNKLKLKNVNRLVVENLNINPLSSKFGQLKLIMEKKSFCRNQS